MSRIRPGVRYTRAQLQELIDQSTADELKLKGYVLRHDVVSDTWSVVPWSQASGATIDGERPRVTGTAQFDPVDPITKRTPQARLDSLMLRVLQDAKEKGRIDLPDDVVSAIVGEAWVNGRNEITAEVVRTVAAHFLQDAENKAS